MKGPILSYLGDIHSPLVLYRTPGVDAEVAIARRGKKGLVIHFPSKGTSPARGGKPGKRRNPDRLRLASVLVTAIVEQAQPVVVNFTGGKGGNAIRNSFGKTKGDWTDRDLASFQAWLDRLVTRVGNYRFDVWLSRCQDPPHLDRDLPFNMARTGKVSRSLPHRFD